MNAKEARKMTETALQARNINALLDAVYLQIKRAAQKGDDRVINPLKNLRQPVTPEQEKAVSDVLKKADYKIATLPNGDMEVSW